MLTATATRISLETGCDHACCSEFAFPLYRQLSRGRYDVCSVLEIGALSEWRANHRTARKRADRAKRRGYRFTIVQRHERADEIFEINTSTSERQGRPMSESYGEFPSKTPLPEYPCPRHGVRTYGVEDEDGQLVAYLWLYRAGELALVSQILGHAAHLENEIMYLLFEGMIAAESCEPGFIVYNRHDSGTDGLRFFKERLGLEATPVEWAQ